MQASLLSLTRSLVTQKQEKDWNYGTTATMPAQGQLLVNIEDMSKLRDIKKAISMVKGVGKITVPRRKRLYSAYELSLRDLDEGRVTTHASVDDYFKSFGL